YDANNNARLSHGVHSLTLNQKGTFQGYYQVGSDPLKTAFVSGYMATVPQQWQSLLGGPVLTGNCCLSIIGRTSSGPAVSVFNPDDIGVKNPVPATELLGYPLAHSTLGGCGGDSRNYFNCASASDTGVVFPAGTRSLLF